MLLVIIGIGLILLIIGIVFSCMEERFYRYSNDPPLTKKQKFKNWLYQNDGCACALKITGAIVSISFVVIYLISGACYLYTDKTIDNKIELYQTENAEIESTIEVIVEGYKDYEQSIFNSVKEGLDPIAVYSMYPELKSNELVAKQIDLYIENKNTIKSLQCEKIENEPTAWWLYFG